MSKSKNAIAQLSNTLKAIDDLNRLNNLYGSDRFTYAILDNKIDWIKISFAGISICSIVSEEDVKALSSYKIREYIFNACKDEGIQTAETQRNEMDRKIAIINKLRNYYIDGSK